VLFGTTAILSAQPSLAQVWARHDALVLAPREEALDGDQAHSHSFTGKRGNRVHAWDLGLKSAPVVLTWGGGPGDTLQPKRLSGMFAHPRTYRHIVLDQPGTGASQWVQGWRPEDSVEDAVAFLDQRGIRGPVIVTGWSWGSTMALLFAQRHPERVCGVVVGGVWTNTPEEVRSYLDADGARAWMPGVSEAFRSYSNGHGTACDLHQAIRAGKGGPALPRAYVEAEVMQCGAGGIPRPVLMQPVPQQEGRPVDMATETDENVKFAFIESEMLCRGQRGAWRLKLRFPKTLARIPLVVIQGRYDQVCMPEIARKVYAAWPGSRKLFVPLNSGHWNFTGPSPESCQRAGLTLTPDQENRLRCAMELDYGSGCIVEAAIEGLLAPKASRATAPVTAR